MTGPSDAQEGAGPHPEQVTRFHLWPGGGVSLGIAHACDLHAHTAVQLSIALAGTFRVRLGPDRPWTRCSAVVIPSERQHEVDSGGEPVATLYLDPSTAVARALARHSKRHIRYFAADQIADLLPRLWTAADAPVAEKQLRGAAPRVAYELARVTHRTAASTFGWTMRWRSCRPRSAGEFTSPRWRTASCCSRRFAHLFHAETGLPFRQYLLWLRLAEALREISTGASLVRAAERAGFSGADPLKRAFRRMLGVPPPLPAPEYG